MSSVCPSVQNFLSLSFFFFNSWQLCVKQSFGFRWRLNYAESVLFCCIQATELFQLTFLSTLWPQTPHGCLSMCHTSALHCGLAWWLLVQRAKCGGRVRGWVWGLRMINEKTRAHKKVNQKEKIHFLWKCSVNVWVLTDYWNLPKKL